jgi:hypothetical protein
MTEGERWCANQSVCHVRRHDKIQSFTLSHVTVPLCKDRIGVKEVFRCVKEDILSY